MNKRKRTWLFISMLLFTLLSLTVQPAQPSAQAAGCASPLPPGNYIGAVFNRVVVENASPDGSISQEISVQYGGGLGIVIDCAGNIIGNFTKTVDDQADIIAKYFYSSSGILGDLSATCELHTSWKIKYGKISKIGNANPKLSWRFALQVGTHTCTGDDAAISILEGTMDPGDQAPSEFDTDWQSTKASSTSVSGGPPWTYGNGGAPLGAQALANIKNEGGSVSENYFFEIDVATPATPTPTPTPSASPTPEKNKPVLSNFRSDIDLEIFLRSIGPVNANVSVDIDWQDGTPGSTTFTVADQAITAEPSGSGATAAIRVDTLPAGASTLSVVATSGEGKSSEPFTIDFHAVDTPAWAQAFKLLAQPQADSVFYEHTVTKNFPEQALEGTISIPDAVPYLGGTWGLLHTQFQAGLASTSAGGISNGPVTGSGGFAAGQSQYNLTVDPYDSYTRTRLQEDGLTFDSGHAAISLPELSYTKKVSLFTLIPGATALESIPGNPLGALDLTAFQATVNASVAGHTNLGVDQNEVKFVSGDATTNMGVLMAAGVGTGPAGVFLVGTIGGKLVWNLAPSPSVTDCSVTVAAYVFYYYPFGHMGTIPAAPESKQIVGCSNVENYSGSSAGNLLASPLQVSPSQASDKRPDGWQPEQVVAAPTEKSSASGVLTSTLVEQANPVQAMPALAAGPSGRMAVSWVGEAPDKPRPQAWQTTLRLYDGKSWGSPIVVSNTANPAASSTVAWDAKGEVVVAWLQGGSDLNESSSFDANLVKNLDIAWAVIDPASSQIVKRGVMPGDDITDFAPQLAGGTDGSVWLAWESSPASTFVGTAAAPNILKVARWDGQSWQGTEQVTDKLEGTTRWQLAARDATAAYLVANMRPDGVTSVVAFTCTDGKWGAAQTLVDNIDGTVSAAAAYQADGKPVAAWSDQSHVSGVIGDLAPTPTRWFTGTSDLDMLLPGADGGLAAIMSGETTYGRFGTSVVRYNPNGKTWSAPTVLEDGEAPIFDMPQGASNSSGDIVTVFAKSVPNPVKVQGADNTEMTVQWVPTFASVDMLRVPGALAVAISNSTNSASGAGNAPASSSLSGTTLLVLGGGAVALLLLLVLLFVVRAGSRAPALATSGGSAAALQGKRSNGAATLIILLLMLVVLGLAGAYLFGFFGKQQEAVPSGALTLSATSTAVIVPTSTPTVLPSATEMPTKVLAPSPTTEPSATSQPPIEEPPTDTPEPPTPEAIATTVTFDKIDGCSLMSDAGAEAVLGTPDGTPGPASESGPVLGSCHWVTAKLPNGQVPEMSMTIYHFDGDPKDQFKTFISRYAGEDKPVEGLGDEAVWYTSPIGGELAIRQGALIIWFLDFRYAEETIEQYAESLISNLP